MVDVRGHGTSGVGPSADTVDLRVALRRMSSSGGPLVLPAGRTFVIDGPLQVPDGTVIRGEGASSKVVFTPASPGALFNLDSVSDVHFEDFQIVSSSPNATEAFVFANATSCSISRVKVRGDGGGFPTAAVRITNHGGPNCYSILLQMDIGSCVGDGIRIEGPTSNAGIVIAPGSQVGQCGGYGINTGVDGLAHEVHALGAVIQGSLAGQISGSFYNGVVMGCHLENSTASRGAPLQIGAGQVFRSLQVVGCLIANGANQQADAGAHGLDIQPGFESTGLTVEGCTFTAATHAAAKVDRVIGFRFANNTIHADLAPLDLGESVSGIALELSRAGEFGVRATVPIRTVRADHVATLYDEIILVDVDAPVTVTLPPASSLNGGGQTYVVKNTGNQGQGTSIVTSAGESIEGEPSLVLQGKWKGVTLVSDGSRWVIVSRL